MIVSKVYDEYTDAYYYYNADTGEAFWDKPLILGSQDLEDIQESEEDISSDDAKETGPDPTKRKLSLTRKSRKMTTITRRRVGLMKVKLPETIPGQKCRCW